MANPIIRVNNLIKKYEKLEALKGISFEVFEGEIFGLLGPNGAGKTTTLEIIETLRKKTSGSVEVAGYDIDINPQKIKQLIGVQLQAAGYYPTLNLTQLLNLFAGLYNIKIDPLEILQSVGLEAKATAKFKQLSGGQKQRFSIATTLLHNPKVIFLDEPTTGLDPQSRRNLWDLIKNIQSKGTTIVITTHYMEEAEQLAHRVAIIDQGQIIAINTPSVLIQQLLDSGFQPKQVVKPATLEDVFLQLTGKEYRE